MFDFFRSSMRFLGRITKRAFAGLVWWLLDVTDLYSKIIAPQLPEGLAAGLQPYTVYLNVLTPWVIAAILLWAILYTYYESEKRVTRDPRIPKRLREFYVQSDPFTRYDLNNESEFPEWKNRVHQWHTEAEDWIRENMGDAALIRFQETPLRAMGNMYLKNSAAVNDEHDRLVRAVKESRENLQSLIENEAWDAKDKKEHTWRLANIFRWKKPAKRSG